MSTPTTAARVFKIGVGLFLMAAGLSTTALLYYFPYRRAMETRAWTETPCTITESRMDEYRVSEMAEPVARVFLKYGYTFDGKDYTGTRWRRVAFSTREDTDVSMQSSKFETAEALKEKFPPGRETVCWVNPQSPQEAVLEHQSKAAIYTLWWPMIFAVGGGGMVWSAIRHKKKPLPVRAAAS